jgi:NAD(P)H-hydrate epimerase
MKILSTDQIRQADAYTIVNEPISSIDLMERAATQCFNWIKSHISKSNKFKVFCGTGNNGGDGLVIARLLLDKNYDIEIYIVKYSVKFSEDFNANYERLIKYKKVSITEISKNSELPVISPDDIIIDAIFGTGLSKPVKGFTAELIEHLNKSLARIISIDIPSGLFGDINFGKTGAVIIANYTLTFQQPKLSFLFSSNSIFVGEWQVLNIGLDKEFINSVKTKDFYIDISDCKSVYKPRNKFSHKGNYGSALLVSGSYGKMGAAILSAKACLKAGVGLLTVQIPKSGYQIIQTAVAEAMAETDSCESHISDVIDIKNFNAIGIGPGIGTKTETQKVLKMLIQNSAIPLVIDADAINILSENKTWLAFLPKGSILTPHPKEFERLIGKKASDIERYELQKALSVKHSVYIILKGANTSISCPDGSCYFNSTGNPGLATAGSGDVLTGILLGLLAQGYNSLETSILGVFLHGLAGDLAAERYGFESTTAGDIIAYLGKAFRKIY